MGGVRGAPARIRRRLDQSTARRRRRSRRPLLGGRRHPRPALVPAHAACLVSRSHRQALRDRRRCGPGVRLVRTTMRAIVILMTLLVPSLAWAQDTTIFHVPAAEAAAGAPFLLAARVDHAWESELELRYRPIGTLAWRTEPFRR